MATKKRQACKYGEKCYRKNRDHLRDYWHPSPSHVIKEHDQGESAITCDSGVKVDKKQEKLHGHDLEQHPVKRRRTGDSNLPSPSSYADKDQKDEANIEDGSKEEDHSVEESQPPSPEDVKENIKKKCLFEMPSDFYQFWDFCSCLNSSDPENALKCVKLKLVGAFDILRGKHKKVRRNKQGREPNFLLHYRYYYDPPEFQTVLASTEKDCFHIGYFRDDPSEQPAFVASNTPTLASSKEKIIPCGENLFSAVHILASKMLKTASPFDKTSIQKLIKSIEKECAKLDLDLSVQSKGMKARKEKVVCPSFHGAGIVVPVDENEIGYRPVPESISDLKAMFKRIADAKTDENKERHMEDLQELITLVQFANDECDYGEGLELGMDLFSYGGEVFHPQIAVLLPLAYQLLNRTEFASIINAHLDNRKKVEECVDELL